MQTLIKMIQINKQKIISRVLASLVDLGAATCKLVNFVEHKV